MAAEDATGRVARFGEPFFLQWSITDACNLRCSHCYRGAPRGDLGLDDLLGVLDSYQSLLADIGRDGRVMLSGGEPLLSPHLYDLAERCRAAALPVRVLSNGTLIDREAARALADVDVRAVQVSVEGPRRLHDAVRGTGAYAAALDGMRALREAGIDVTLALTLTSENRQALPAVARTARRYANRFHVARHVPIGRGAAAGGRPLTATEVHDALAWLDSHAARWQRAGIEVPRRDPLWAPLAGAAGCDGCIGGCSIGFNGIAVDSDATAYPCRRLPIPLGNVFATPLIELWRHPALERLRDRDALEGRCGRCEIRWRCGGCRAVAEALLGYPLDEDPQCFHNVPTPGAAPGW